MTCLGHAGYDSTEVSSAAVGSFYSLFSNYMTRTIKYEQIIRTGVLNSNAKN